MWRSWQDTGHALDAQATRRLKVDEQEADTGAACNIAEQQEHPIAVHHHARIPAPPECGGRALLTFFCIQAGHNGLRGNRVPHQMHQGQDEVCAVQVLHTSVIGIKKM
jgi:hypothetical protein